MLGVAILWLCLKNTAINMSAPTHDDSLLLIRCPSCGQRFKVGEDLRERTVECGGCEHRFRINDAVIVRGPKSYPGERHSLDLHRFQRVPMSGGEVLMGGAPIRYSNMPDPARLEPISPLRIIAGIAGVSGMILLGLLLMLGAGRGGMLDGMIFSNRMVMVAFASLLGVGMLIYANPRARLKAFAVGALLCGGLVSVPFYFRGGSVPLPSGTIVSQNEDLPAIGVPGKNPQENNEIAALRNRIGTGPLVTEIERLTADGSTRRAAGLWLRGLSDSNRFLVRDYILRVTSADPSSHFYPRDGGDYLLVVTGINQSLQELADLANALGQTEKIYPEISVVEVRVRNDAFMEGSIEKLSKREDPAFYDLNKRELESIDLERVKRAVQRIAEAEPKLYRADITRKLISLLGDSAVDFKGNVCRALSQWSEKPGPASEAALIEVRKLISVSKEIPPEMIALIVKEKNLKVIPILDELWVKNPMAWESVYADIGPEIESTVIRRMGTTRGTIRYSAVRILGRVGGAESLPVLTAAQVGADSELRVLVEQAQKSINTRIHP